MGDATFAALDADVDTMARRLQPIVPAPGRVAVQVQGSGLHRVAAPTPGGVHQARTAVVRDPGCDLEAVRAHLRAALP